MSATIFRAISLWQPWASAMASGVKQNETRDWAIGWRGDLVICSSKRQPWREECNDDEAYDAAMSLPYGCALCIVELWDCVPVESIQSSLSQAEADLGNYTPGRFAWRTRNCRKLKTPVPIIGRQKLWILPPEAASRVSANLP